jgi:hypothetical protein
MPDGRAEAPSPVQVGTATPVTGTMRQARLILEAVSAEMSERTGGGMDDVVTVVVNLKGRANKLISRDKNGEFKKDGTSQISDALAAVVHVADVEAMDSLLKLVGQHTDACLWLGRPVDAEVGQIFSVISQRRMAEAIGVKLDKADLPVDRNQILGWHEVDGARAICRLSDNALPSSWILLDRDYVGGMPDAMTFDDTEGWWEAMCRIFPGFVGAGRVELPSTSSRVLVDGKPYAAKPSSHTFLQVEDAEDIGRFFLSLLLTSFTAGLGFNKPSYSLTTGEVISARAWSIFDPTVCSSERLVYDGKPTVSGAGLEVTEEVVTAIAPGGRVRTTDLPTPLGAQAEEIRRLSGLRIEVAKSSKSSGRVTYTAMLINDDFLSLTTVLDIQGHGELTLEEAWVRFEDTKMRCQAPERDSDSWAAFLGWHKDGVPFVYDVGVQTKYVLSGDDRRGPAAERYWQLIEELIKTGVDYASIAKEFSEVWQRYSRAMLRHGANEVEMSAARPRAAAAVRKKFSQEAPQKANIVATLKKLDKMIEADFRTSEGEREINPILLQQLGEMNENWFVVAAGGKAFIGRWKCDHQLRRETLEAYPPSHVEMLTSDRLVSHPVTNNLVPLSEAWLGWQGRQAYPNGFAFVTDGEAPIGQLNLWRGFGVTPGSGDCTLICEHIRDVVCGSDQKVYDWLLKLFAYWVQHPAEQGYTIVVMRSEEEGTGKGVIARLMVKLFGQHGLQITQSKHLVGHFNAHLLDCCMLYADEAFFAGDKQHEGVLKAIGTEPTIMIEPKGINPFPIPNRLKVIMTSNSDWVVPAGVHDRRYLVLDVSANRRGDEKYFDALYKQIDEQGGAEAFLQMLLDIDLNGFNPRKRPNTTALERQKELSLSGVSAWLYDCLLASEFSARKSLEGSVRLEPVELKPEGGYSPLPTPTVGDVRDAWRGSMVQADKHDVYDAFKSWFGEPANRHRNGARPPPESQFWRSVYKLTNDTIRDYRPAPGPDGKRPPRVAAMQPLGSVRAAFAVQTGINFEEDDP